MGRFGSVKLFWWEIGSIDSVSVRRVRSVYCMEVNSMEERRSSVEIKHIEKQ